MYENALGRSPVAQDDTDLNQLIGQFTSSGNHIDELLIQLVGNDGFRFATPM